MHVAAVVLNWDGAEETFACVRSLFASHWSRLTVIVVDNGSDHDLGAELEEQFPQAILVRNPRNLGFSGGMNAGIRYAVDLSADYVLLLNNDALVDESTVDRLVAAAASRPDAGIVCPVVLSRERPTIILNAGLRCDLRRGHQGPPLGRGEVDHGQYGEVRAVDAPSGAAMLVPTPVIERVGMLDEDLFLYGEDVDWAARMRAHGLRTFVAGGARLWHGHSVSSGGENSPLSAYYVTRNAFTVCARHAPLPRWRAHMRSAEIILANLAHARRGREPIANARAVLTGWRHYRRGIRGPCPPGALGRQWPAPLVSPRVALSTGFDKTHVTTAAREALDRHHLAAVITGAYPTDRIVRFARAVPRGDRGRLARLLDRGEEIPASWVRVLWAPELLYVAGKALSRLPRGEIPGQHVCVASWRLYGQLAARHLTRIDPTPEIYHFRAGYGQASIDRARELGMRVVCDHAIAHPAMLEVLLGQRESPDGRLRNPVNRAALRDIERSDCVLVNSDFVKETFLDYGWSPDRVRVVYLGVDDNFLRHIPDRPRAIPDVPLTLLFAGRLERRKGVDVLATALEDLDDVVWTLRLAGPLAPETAEACRGLLSHRRVTVLGNLRRRQLVEAMRNSAVFVFPTLAEGSARVVFEALACGCYVITTPAAGSIVEDGVHGALVAPGDAKGLRDAIVAAASDPARVARIGAANATLVREHFTQRQYGEALEDLYRGVLAPLPRLGTRSLSIVEVEQGAGA